MGESSKPMPVSEGVSNSGDFHLRNQNAPSGETGDQVTASRSKKGTRSRLTDYQKQVLKRAFASSPYLTSTQQTQVAVALGISKQVLQNWFKNKRYRMRLKMESTENKTAPHFNYQPAAMHYIENPAVPQTAPDGFFYHDQCFSASHGEEPEMDYLFPPVTTSYYFH